MEVFYFDVCNKELPESYSTYCAQPLASNWGSLGLSASDRVRTINPSVNNLEESFQVEENVTLQVRKDSETCHTHLPSTVISIRVQAEEGTRHTRFTADAVT